MRLQFYFLQIMRKQKFCNHSNHKRPIYDYLPATITACFSFFLLVKQSLPYTSCPSLKHAVAKNICNTHHKLEVVILKLKSKCDKTRHNCIIYQLNSDQQRQQYQRKMFHPRKYQINYPRKNVRTLFF